jgi:photosystem II stability/assembly factor-like uncharacterized protein
MAGICVLLYLLSLTNPKMKNIVLSIIIVTSTFAASAQKKNEKETPKQATLSGIAFREIGPALVSGRVIDLAVNPNNYDEFFVAAASGGVWKTVNHGNTFTPVFDGQGSYSIGCVAYDPNNEHTLWVGTGENNNQRSVAYGDGVYKSLDDGKTWKNMGLKNSEHIAKILVKPGNSNVVYVAAYGPLWSEGGERGIYQSNDGGENWERILHVSDNTGFSDLWMDPRNSDVMYASAHQRRRHVWTYLSGGPESAIYKTTDGGKNWRKIMSGLPNTDLGRIALAVSPANPDVVYAMVEGFDEEHGGFYRSNNMGESWSRQSDYFTSGNYYVELIPDPADENKVFSMDTWLHHTEDGGKTFKKTGEKSKHVDNHAMWIDPGNTGHWLVGCDGGLYETWDAANNWQFYQNLNITQFYRVAVDYDEPFYNVYGGTQDNNTIGGPSRTTNAHGTSNFDWYITRGGDGFEPAVDPTNPDIVYSQSQYGWLVRYNRKTGEKINIKPIERKGEDAYRWNWDAPLLISPHNPKRLYFAANKVFMSDDRGDSWNVVSEDLSQQIDRNKLKVMGTTWGPDAVALHKSTTIYGNLVVLEESPVTANLLYAGTDDGLIHRTSDLKAWTKLSAFPGVPAGTYVNDILCDRFDEGTVYAAFNNHKNGDFKPYILKSTDRGNNWISIAGDLPERGSVYCIEQDPENKNLLFVGTEFGVFFTIDGGKKWVKISGGLPTIAIRDMEIQKRENDLVIASFGRGFYVLDDYSPLRSISDTSGSAAHIFRIKDALAFNVTNPLGTRGKASQGESFFTAPNPPIGATFTYFLGEKPMTLQDQRRQAEKKIRKDKGDVGYPSFDELRNEDLELKPYLIFEIKDKNGKVVSRYKEEKVNKGINQSTWDFRLESTTPVELKESEVGRYSSPDWGALALPGEYSVTIHQFLNGELTQLAGPENFRIKLLHESQISKPDYAALTRFIEELNEGRRQVMNTTEELKELKTTFNYIQNTVLKAPNADISILTELDRLNKSLNEISVALYGDGTKLKREAEAYPGIVFRVEVAAGNIFEHTEAPTQSEQRSFEVAMEEHAEVRASFEKAKSEIAAISKKLKDAKAPYFKH